MKKSLHISFFLCRLGTIQGLIGRYCSRNQTSRYIDRLPEILSTYHNREHRMIKMTPNQAERPESQYKLMQIFAERYGKIKRQKKKFHANELCRISTMDSKFKRSYQPQAQEEVFVIDTVIDKHKIPFYKIRTLNGEEIIDGTFMGSFLFANWLIVNHFMHYLSFFYFALNYNRSCDF